MQKEAASKLLGLLDVRDGESVLDVACGPGHLTRWLADTTGGRVVGTDISRGMIEEAASLCPDIEFRQVAAEDLDYHDEFDVVFCNSALQWFADAGMAMRAMHEALERPGRLGLACPATFDFAPWFGKMVLGALRRPELAEVFSHWRKPWFQLKDVDAYRGFFEQSGFETSYISLDHEVNAFTVEQAYGIWDTGAAQGFLGMDYYDIEIDSAFIESFNHAVREEMEKDAPGGLVEVTFNRLYYIGLKQ